jgi:hypothetical protein
MTLSNDLGLMLESVRYEVNYVDYPDDQFTVPIILTQERAEKIVSDNSIRKVRFTPILQPTVNITLDHQCLVLNNRTI